MCPSQGVTHDGEISSSQRSVSCGKDGRFSSDWQRHTVHTTRHATHLETMNQDERAASPPPITYQRACIILDAPLFLDEKLEQSTLVRVAPFQAAFCGGCGLHDGQRASCGERDVQLLSQRITRQWRFCLYPSFRTPGQQELLPRV